MILETVLSLVLLVDVSTSVDDNEYKLQRDGIATAFLDPGVQRAIISQGGACVAYVEWAHEQKVMVGWQRLRTTADMRAFAVMVASTQRSMRGITHIDKALSYAVSYAATSPCEGRMIFDVSGDGCQYGGASTKNILALADARGIQINGLAILGDPRIPIDCQGQTLDGWYRDNVAVNGFVLVAEDFNDFQRAIRQKLALEIAKE